MKLVAKLVRKQKRTGNGVYYIYTYQLSDGLTVNTLREYKIGDRVEVWFDNGWNVPKIRLYKEKRK